MAVKFPLKMADGFLCRTLEDLREHFDVASLLLYYDNRRLETWLKNGYYDQEAVAVAALDASTENFEQELCEILGLTYVESEYAELSIEVASAKEERRRWVSQRTSDPALQKKIDQLDEDANLAFSQEDLKQLLQDGVQEIYLCGDRFILPGDVPNIDYIGLQEPTVVFDCKYIARGITVRDAVFDIDTYARKYAGDLDRIFDFHPTKSVCEYNVCEQEHGRAVNASLPIELQVMPCFDGNISLYADILNALDDKGRVGAAYTIGYCLEINGETETALEYYASAAKKGYELAQMKMGVLCEDDDEKERWLRKAAKQGSPQALFELGYFLCTNGQTEEGIELSRQAARKGDSLIQLGYLELFFTYAVSELDQPDEDVLKEILRYLKKFMQMGLPGMKDIWEQFGPLIEAMEEEGIYL